jgi:dUTP pyrophosphatase
MKEHPLIKVVTIGERMPDLYNYELDSGCDVRYNGEEEIKLESLERYLVPTGIRLDIPSGYEAQIRPRSGNALKRGLTILNSPATIDCGYHGEIKVIVVNLSKDTIVIKPEEKIAQLVFSPVVKAIFIPKPDYLENDDLDIEKIGNNIFVKSNRSLRKNKGFGSSGVI